MAPLCPMPPSTLQGPALWDEDSPLGEVILPQMEMGKRTGSPRLGDDPIHVSGIPEGGSRRKMTFTGFQTQQSPSRSKSKIMPGHPHIVKGKRSL